MTMKWNTATIFLLATAAIGFALSAEDDDKSIHCKTVAVKMFNDNLTSAFCILLFVLYADPIIYDLFKYIKK